MLQPRVGVELVPYTEKVSSRLFALTKKEQALAPQSLIA